MIITLTGNLLAERTLEFASWQPGKTQRATAESFQVGGKGVNVSKMLIRIGARTVAACFAGGAPGDECMRWLHAHAIEHRAFRTVASTRTGTVVRTTTAAPAAPATTAASDAQPQPETTFLGPDVAPDAGALAECAAWLDAQPVTHTLAMCGSFPGWLSSGAALLRHAVERRIAHGGVYVDTYGPPLAWFVEKPVTLVKINRTEFDQLCVSAITSDPTADHILALAQNHPMPMRLTAALRHWPVRAWVITDGPGPVWFASRDGAPPASLQPPAIREVSATGSGDVLFAAMLHNLKNRHFSLADALTDAIPYASANASSSGIADINIK